MQGRVVAVGHYKMFKMIKIINSTVLLMKRKAVAVGHRHKAHSY